MASPGAKQPGPNTPSFASLSQKKRGYGIRDVDGEYSDYADMVAFSTASPVHDHVTKLLEIAESNKRRKAELAAMAKVDDCLELERQQLEKRIEEWRESRSEDHLLEQWIECQRKDQERTAKILRDVEEVRRKQEIENDLLEKAMAEYSLTDKFFVSSKTDEGDLKKLAELESLELQTKVLEAKRAEAQEQQRKALEEKQQRERVAAQKLKLEQEKAAALELRTKLEQQRTEAEQQTALLKQQEAKRLPQKIGGINESLVPSELQGCITYEDLQKYSQSQHLLDKIQEDTKHITKNSKFYNGSIHVVNAPLNQISAQTQGKIGHFTALFEGKGVSAPALSVPFSTQDEKNGDFFVKNLFAFRFVKKAEADSSENKLKRENLNYLAVVGVALIKKFPGLDYLIQAHFYKACPFLVPFSYPRNGMDIRSYAGAIGHHISENENALEATITQTLLDKLTGYCLLYGFMVRNTCSSPSTTTTSQGTPSFFSLHEVWRILATTLSLDPQDEVTATILYNLLQILDKDLASVHGRQYKKLLLYTKDVYVEKIRNATSKGKTGSLSRLELFLERAIP